jgi:dihydrofolate reductase
MRSGRAVRQYLNGLTIAGKTMAKGHHMRPVVLQFGLTLDGFIHGDKGYEDWGLPPEDEEVVEWKAASLRQAGTHIMGRVSYEAMASVWPTSTGIYADLMNKIPKVVFSKTLARADWAESRIASGDLVEDIERLKREPGGVILAHGGATFVDALIRNGLIDEYRLVIHPVVIGHGTGLFGGLGEPLRLNLVEARTFPSGTAIHVYQPRKRDR